MSSGLGTQASGIRGTSGVFQDWEADLSFLSYHHAQTPQPASILVSEAQVLASALAGIRPPAKRECVRCVFAAWSGGSVTSAEVPPGLSGRGRA